MKQLKGILKEFEDGKIAVGIIISFALALLIMVLSSCNKKPIPQPNYTNYLIINDTIVSSLYSVNVYDSSINLKPEYGIVVLGQKHDSIFRGYMIIFGTPYHYDSVVCAYNVNEGRAYGYAYGKMTRNICPPNLNYIDFKLKFNLPL